MKIDLTRLTIDFPQNPTQVWDHSSSRIYYDYRVYGLFESNRVGYVNVSIPGEMNDKKNDFWFEKRGKIWIPRPVAVFQSTEEEYRGQGVSGQLLILVNQFVKNKYDASLASDTIFCSNPVGDWHDRGFSSGRPAKRVWRKLEELGLAYRRNYRNSARWVMI
jgi:hypothetical protein